MQDRIKKALCMLAICAIVGIGPLAYLLLWWGNPVIVEPLKAPITIQNGEYVSAFFTTYVVDQYQIGLYLVPPERSPLDVDWKVVNDSGAVIASGVFKEERTGGNDAILGYYRSARWSRQRLILSIHQDSDQAAFSTSLHIGMPERSLEMAEGGIPLALAWAALMGLVGVIWLAIYLWGNRVASS